VVCALDHLAEWDLAGDGALCREGSGEDRERSENERREESGESRVHAVLVLKVELRPLHVRSA
jgi:hypothetical protein